MCSTIKTTGTKLSLRVPGKHFVGTSGLVPTVGANAIARRAVGLGMRRVLRALVTCNVLSGRRGSDHVPLSGPFSHRATLRLTHRKMMLLGGRSGLLPLGKGATMVKPGTGLVPANNNDNFIAPFSAIAITRNLGSLGGGGLILLASSIVCRSVIRRFCASTGHRIGNFGTRCFGGGALSKRPRIMHARSSISCS